MKAFKYFLFVLSVLFLTGGILVLLWIFALPTDIREELKEAVGIMEDSGITGEDCTFDIDFYPYYKSLSTQGQSLYAQVYANALAGETTFVPVVDVSIAEVENVVKLVYYDHPELFWMDSGYSYKYNEKEICVQITLKFNETVNDLDASKEAFESAANRIVEEAKVLGSDYEKERHVYMSIIQMTEYDSEASIHQSPYSALVNGKSVCAGYARAFQYIMTKLGIPTYYCAGMVDGHAWNIVQLEGDYYNVDLTMADKDGMYEKFLNRTDDSLGYSHRRSGYSVMLPKCTSTRYSSEE